MNIEINSEKYASCISNFWWSNCYNTSTTFQKQNQFILIMSHFHAVKQNKILCIILNHLFCSKHFKHRWIDQGYGQGDLKCRPLLLSERSPLIFYMQGKLITFFPCLSRAHLKTVLITTLMVLSLCKTKMQRSPPSLPIRLKQQTSTVSYKRSSSFL